MDRTLGRWMLVIVIASLLVNVHLVRKTNRLEGEIRNLGSLFSHSLSSVSSAVSHVNSRLAAMAQAAEWYAPPRFDVEAIPGKAGEAMVTISWSFRELAKDAAVGLTYRLAGGSWQEAEVVKVGEALYEAKIHVEVDLSRPIWGVAYSHDVPAGSRTQSVTATKESAPSRLGLEYMIHSIENGVQKSGRMESIDLSKIAAHFHVNLARAVSGEWYRVNVDSLGPYLDVELVAQVEVVALGATESESIASLVLEHARVSWMGVLNIPKGKEAEVQRIGIVVTYKSGETAVKHIEVR